MSKLYLMHKLFIFALLILFTSCIFSIEKPEENDGELKVTFSNPKPMNGADNVLAASSIQITLSDWDEFKVSFDFYIDTTDKFLAPYIKDFEVFENPINIDLDEFLQPDKTYYWKMVLKHNNGKTASSEIYSFKTTYSVTDRQKEMLVKLGLNAETGRAKWADGYVYSLDLSKMNLTSLPSGMKVFEKLVVLDLKENLLSSLPDDLMEIKTIEMIDFSSNLLETIPSNIGNWAKLTYCNLSKNKLQTLPASIGYCKEIKTLEASLNELKSIPDALGTIEMLKMLFLGSNQLKTLPESLTQLENLQLLDVQDNQIEKLSFVKEFKHLVSFNASKNKIDEVRFDAPHLIDLWLDNNQLKSLTTDFVKYKKLESLHCQSNIISTVSDLSALKNLKTLALRNNALSCEQLDLLKKWSDYIPNVYTLGNATCW